MADGVKESRDEIAAVARQGTASPRQNRRVELQQRQRLENRERIVQAALEAVGSLPYAALAVEDVIRRAGVSRATFYKHFDSKFAVVRVLHARYLDRLYAIYDTMVEIGNPGDEEIARWIESVVAFYRREQVLTMVFSHMQAIEPAFQAPMRDIEIEIIRRWSTRMPAFRRALTTATMVTAPQIEAHLLLRGISNFGVEVALFGADIALHQGALVLARHFRRFVELYGEIEDTREAV